MIISAHLSTSFPRRQHRAITVTEVLVTMGLLAMIGGISFAVIGTARRGRAQAVCAANLHSIGNAFTLYLTEFHDVYPAPTPDVQWEDILRRYITRPTFQCPADNELFTSLGSSYDWRDTGNPLTTLAGRPVLQVAHSGVVLSYEALPGWHAQGKIQAVRVDSAVELMDQTYFFQELQRPPNK